MNNEQTQEVKDLTLTIKVEATRKEARDILRMEKINNLKTMITRENQPFESYDRTVKELEKATAIAKYELKKLDPEHPCFDKMKERAEKEVKCAEENEKETKERIKELKENAEKIVKEYEDKITKWETGEYKVDLEQLTELTKKLLNK